MRRALLLFAWIATADALRAQATARATVTYLSGGTVYVDAGTRAGLREGARLDVIRNGASVATLAVAFVSSTRSACTVTAASSEVVVGDTVQFVPVATVDSAATRDSVRPTRSASRRHALRGRAGLRYVAVDPGGGRATWTQPAMDLRLDGHQLGGTPLGLVLDVRAYRERAGASGRGAAASTRIYQGHLAWEPVNSPLHLGVGRQIAPALSSLGIFDGITAEGRGRHVSGGVVAGTQPEAVSFGWSGLVREYGAWVQAHNATGAMTSWSMTLGGVGSYDRGNIDREYAYLQGMATSRHISFFATQELDVNRGWKAAAEGASTTPTSTYAMLRLSPVDAFSVSVGYDNRRSVRLYRDFVDAETEFDDSFRQGEWAGVSLRAGSHLHANVDARRARGGAGAGSDATSWTASVGATRLTILGLGVNVRSSEYQGSVAAGRLLSASVEVNPWDRFHLEAGGGTRDDRQPVVDTPARTLSWREVNADVAIGRAWFLMVSAYRERGDAGTSTQGYAAISWRF